MNQPKQNSSAAVPVMDAEAIRRALRRIAHEIIERNPRLEKVVIAGIPSRGVEIARRIAGFIGEIEKNEVETGIIDVAMHRDDVGTRRELPVVRVSRPPTHLSKSAPARSKRSQPSVEKHWSTSLWSQARERALHLSWRHFD